MKRIILYCILFAGALMVPLKKIDISNLEPIQAVKMERREESILLQTDTGDVGVGANVQQALENLKQTSAGIVYLDTAEYLLVSQNAREYIGHLKPYLKDRVRICQWDGQGELTEVAKYMDAHKIGVKLRNWHNETILPKLQEHIQK